MKKQKGIVSPSYALRPEFVRDMRLFANQLHTVEREKSRIQYAVAKKLIDEWNSGEYTNELTKDEFYCEASRVICDELGIALVSTTGETVKVWVEVFQHFENTPEDLKRDLPFEYFKQARWLYNQKYVAVPMAAISTALDHKLTSSEMKRWYTGDAIPEPNVLEFRNKFPRPVWGLYDWLESANGNREQMEFHIGEIIRLHEAK